MTKIKFFKKRDIYLGYEITGHTGYADNGEDILCASISTLSQACILGIREVLHIDCNFVKKDNDAYLKLELPKNLDEGEMSKCQILLKTLYLSLEDLKSGYSQYISMEVIDDVY